MVRKKQKIFFKHALGDVVDAVGNKEGRKKRLWNSEGGLKARRLQKRLMWPKIASAKFIFPKKLVPLNTEKPVCAEKNKSSPEPEISLSQKLTA